MPEALRNNSRSYEEFNQCIKFTFLRLDETKDSSYEILIDAYSCANSGKTVHIVHRKLRNALRNETLWWMEKEQVDKGLDKSLERCLENVKNFYFEYWKDVMRGEVICPECRQTMAMN